MTVKNKLSNRILSILLCFTLFMTHLPLSVWAANGYAYKGGAGNKLSDRDTSTKYSESLGDNASTEYAGRIWTDKSVYTDDVTFNTYGGGTSTIKLNENENGEDFLVAYSALATSEAVSGQTQAPVDVVFIIDTSGSMTDSMSNSDNTKRIVNTVTALNDAIDEVMKLNKYTRVGVVAFSNYSEVLLELGRYEKGTRTTGSGFNQSTVTDYFSFSGSTLYVHAKKEGTNTTVTDTRSVSGGTNIQRGIYEGMNMLATEKSTSANINGSEVKRVPSVILLSDGAPTYSAGDTTQSNNRTRWWNPANNNNQGDGNNPYYGNGMKALMTGAYMKEAINRNYGVTNTNMETTMYSIGMGIKNLNQYNGERNLAYITLNPKAYWDADNSMSNNIRNAWRTYTTNNGTPNVNTTSYQSYTFTHPTQYDIDGDSDALKNLMDAYYDADNASAVTSVFKEIVANIAISAPQVPTEIKGNDPLTDGYITYTDPIGKYMEVKDVKAIIYAGQTFTKKTVTAETSPATYVFEGEVHSPVYGDQSIDKIVITVTEDTSGDQTLVIKIPASVIPLRVNEVTLNTDGTVKTHTNNGAYPARIVYSVGLKDEILKESDDGVIYIDRSKISNSYLAANTNDDGTINFYSNVYSNTNEVNGSTAGDATVEFEPSHTNGFYYILDDMPIYKDAGFKNQVTASEGIKDNTVYYYRDEYYHGSSIEVDAIERTGAQLKRTEIKTGNDGYLYRAPGSPRLNRILKFEGTKIANATKTAEDFYAPTFEYAQNSTNPYDGKFVVYLGNNGRLSVVAGGNLEISKEVNAGIGLTAPDKEFEFTIDLDGAEVNQGEYDYLVVDAKGETVKTGSISKDNTKITLKDGQTATVLSLPPSTTYTVTEKAADGFTAESDGASGTISANETSVAKFTNTYNVEPVNFPTSGSLSGQKVLSGREWSSKDSFTFFISPYNNAPLPENYDKDAGVTVNKPDTESGQSAVFDFGTIKFTAPGTYRYTIVEKEPENEEYLPGMSYSRALYRLVVNVEDNGNGTLKIASYDIQRLYDDNANPLFTYNSNNEIVMNEGQEAQDEIKFTNTYSAAAVTRVPVALKDYTDNSGQNPLVSGMFQFELKALGIVENNNVAANTASKVPMPEGSNNGSIITSNEGHNVTFPSVTFTQDLLPDNATSVTFRYQMSEVIPATRQNGMTYDDTKYIIDVVVSIDPNSNILSVNAIYPNDERIVTFNNEYTPVAVTADINGNKTLIGRDMKSGESFEFNISAANAATNNAVRNGILSIPSATAEVKNGKDGIASAFTFEDIEFKKAGTYTFAVSETKGNSPAVEYDESTVTVTVIIDDADKDGNLEVSSVTYAGGRNSADFTNRYTSEFTGEPESLSGTKNLIGKTLLDGEFHFNVAEYYNGKFVKEGLVSHTKDETPDSNGVYTGTITLLDKLTFDKTGRYEYYITEQIPTPKVGGTTYDESQFRYTIVVADDLNGNLKVDSRALQIQKEGVWVNADEVVFNNQYKPTPTTAKIPLINKVISGDRADGLKADEFKFVLSEVSSDPADGMKLPDTKEVTNNANGNILFDEITFTKAGTYTVSVKEDIPDDAHKLAGITYSTQEIRATYTVVDDRNGNLTATLTDFTGDTIINQYKTEPAEVTVDIKKNFTGRDNDQWLATDKFDFEIVVLDPNTSTAIENGDIEFPTDSSSDDIVKKSIDVNTPNKTVSGKIKINKQGTYKFIVREITGDIPGVHYDSQPREITVEATDDSDTAKFDIKINGTKTDNLTLTFNNRYDATSTEISGHDHLSVEKIFTGRVDNEWLDTDEFKFTLEAYDDVTKNAVESNDIEMPASKELSVSNANKAHPHFGNIIFHAQGTYKFIVTELDNKIKGVTYDTDRDRIVIVEVEDNDKGELIAKIAQGSEKLSFTNTYSTTEVTLEGKTKLEITKSLAGRKWFSDDKFTFTISPIGEATVNAISANDIVMPASNEIEIKAPNQGYDGSVTGHFGDITFKKVGSYRFVITETVGNIDNITYDEHSYYVEVEVTDDTEGGLVATPAYYFSSVFTNTYKPDSVFAEIIGKKSLTGNRDLADGEFEFKLTAVTNNAPLPADTTVKNTSKDVIDFGSIEFDADGTYVYEISEVKGRIPGVTYDEKKVTATVTVSYDSSTGKLSANVSYTKDGSSASDTFTFNNSYKAEASEPISLTAKKKVTPSDGNSFTLKGGEFSFVIEGTKNVPSPATVKNDANGNIDFGTVKFTEEGTYIYTIREVQENLGGFTYDSSVYTVTVEVTDNTDEAKLEITSVKTTDSENKEAEAIFDNKYNPKETSALIFGSKALEGGHKELEADEFEFSIEAVTENAPMPEHTTVKNEATGVFQFDTITYKKVGTYEYKITEKNLGKKGYTYDDKSYTVTVKVTDEGKGQLLADVEGVGTAQNPAIKFVNKYVPDAVDVELGANGELIKELEGRDMNENEFIFALIDSENKEVTTAKNDKDGKFKFTLNFTKAGTYNYTIAEKNNEVAGVTYDESIFGVEIVIADKGGYLEAESIVYKLENETVENILFKNTYKADGTDITINAIKKLIGRELKDGEFKFILKDENGEVISTVTNAKDGKIVFDKISFAEAGTYKYTVSEENGELENITYDETEYVIEITVEDDGKGKLVASEPVIKKADSDNAVSEITFENTYTAPKVPEKPEIPEAPKGPQTGDNSNLWMWFALLFISGGVLTSTAIYGRKRKEAEEN